MRIERVETDDGVAAALAVRRAVFTDEQGIDPSADRDGRDDDATHLLAVAESSDKVPTDDRSATTGGRHDAEPLDEVDGVGQPGSATGEGERVVGTCRFRETDAEIRGERLAVLAPYRGAGFGSALVERLLREAVARGAEQVLVHAQADNVPFCRSHGFETTGARFEEVGIEHAEMVHDLTGVRPLEHAE